MGQRDMCDCVYGDIELEESEGDNENGGVQLRGHTGVFIILFGEVWSEFG